ISVPAATACSVKRWRSDSEPSHQAMLAGFVSLATSATQLFRCAFLVDALPVLARVPSVRVNSIIDPIPPRSSTRWPSPSLRPGRNPYRIHVGLARECKGPRDNQLAFASNAKFFYTVGAPAGGRRHAQGSG